MSYPNTVCDKCSHSIEFVRFGVRLTPLKARIFDLIKARPGITRKELSKALYNSNSKTESIASHIKQIRDLFEATDTTIQGISSYGYRIMKRKI